MCTSSFFGMVTARAMTKMRRRMMMMMEKKFNSFLTLPVPQQRAVVGRRCSSRWSKEWLSHLEEMPFLVALWGKNAGM